METVVGSIAVIFFIMIMVLAVRFDDRRRVVSQQTEAEAQTEAQRQLAYEASQRALHQRLQELVAESTSIFHGLPNEIPAANTALDDAEAEFADGAFAPFWDAIERAANSLARFEAGIQEIRHRSDSYNIQKNQLESTPPPFQLQIAALPDVITIVERMRTIVRPAQKDIHFAQIYEARKTNKLLVRGFSSLGEALNDMGSRIASSIDGLSYSMADSISDLAESNRDHAQTIAASVDALNQQMQSDAAAKRQHEVKARDMLDNIQRDRKPLI